MEAKKHYLKTKIYPIIGAIFFMIYISCGSGNEKKETEIKSLKTEDALRYNEKVVDFHGEADNALAMLLFALEELEYNEIVLRKQSALQSLKNIKVQVREMEDFDGNDEFKKKLIEILDVYENLINEELSVLINMHHEYSSLSEPDLEHYNSIFSDALDKYDVAFNEFAIYQANFAEKWDFDLE